MCVGLKIISYFVDKYGTENTETKKKYVKNTITSMKLTHACVVFNWTND